MRLKQFMFALTAMLLSFVSVNAQEGIVAKIGNSEYTTFANAMTDANAATGNVTVEVYGAVEFIDGMELNGSYTAITFTGMSAGAKITINQTAGGDYLTAHGKTVAFNDLILAKANPAWSGNSGHMGNYFSIQGGTVTYTDCTFPNGACTSGGTATYDNCTFQNASEYGLWVYDDALVTVNGGTIDSKKGIKVYSEGEQDVTSTLTVQNATFTENVTAKPAVAVGYAESITLIGNTYNNPTAHVELDSGSDADCEGIAFVAQDSEGNDISSELTVVDRSNSSAACGVLVDGKIYTTVTTAAAEATSGSTVTLLYSTNETVELPEGVKLDTNGFTADNVTVVTSGVAQVGDTTYATLAEAVAAAQAGDEIKLLSNIEGDITVPANVTLNGNGYAISGGIFAEGDITFAGVTTAADFDANVANTAVNIPAGASLQLTGSARLVIGHGATFNITGTITDAKTADKATLVPSLKIAAGASITGNGVTFNVTNAYIVANANTTSKNSNANGTLDFNINNSIWESTGVLAFYVPTSGKDPVVNFDLKNSVLTTTSHLVFSVTKGEIVFDNSLVNQGTSRQLENRSTMTIKNGSVVNGAVATSSNAINPGTIIVENATYAVTGEFSGAAEGTGTLVIKKGANVSVGSIKAGANVTVDAEGMTASDVINFTANLSQFTGTLSVINNDKLEAQIVDGKIVLAVKPVAKIGDVEYATLDEAFGAATEGATITLLADATPALTSQSAITKAAVIDLGGNTLTLTEDDLYFGTTTFKNGTIVVDPSVSASTAVFWMFANQTLTFDNVDIIATGLTGTYLIGINNGTGSSVNLLNGSSITIDNSEKAELSTVIADNGNGNSVIIKDSKIDVKNVDARLYLGGQNGSVTIENSDIVLNGVKEGFYLRAGQTLAINGTSKVDITLNADTKPRYGINMTDATATYTKAETATVNATVYAPATGSNSLAYTKEENGYVRVWGEGGGNAKESYELKLYSGETLIATTKLNNVGNIIDGDVYVTWNFYYPQSTDEYWTTTWEEGHPNSAAQPTEVELYIDGTLVATTAAKMSGADDVAPVVWRNLGGVAIADLLGEGTETSPYLISNKKELLWFQAKVDEQAADGSTQFVGKYFKLTADIDLAGEDWNPIGSMSGDHGSFKGVFDGGDHTISNLKVEQAGNGIGLFARTAGNAVIKNLKLYNVSVKSTDNSNYAGAVVGNAYASTKIENVHVSGNVLVSGRGYIGGIAGHGYVVMDNVSVVATGDGQGNDKGLITSTFWCAGGILGYAGEGATNIMNANVENVIVTSAAGGLGAIVGMAEDNNGTQPISGSNLSAKDVEIKTYIGDFGDSYANYALGYLYGGNPTSKLTGELSVENVTLTTSNGVAPTAVDAIAKVNDAIYFSLQEAIDAAAAGTGNVTVEILRDVDLTDVDWNPVTVSAPGYPVVTVDGNNKTITGLNDMLFAGTWAGGSGLIIKNLTIDESAIVNDKDDANGTVGVGAFIGFPQASATITLENCHLKNSSVEGGHWTGGLIGYAAGYAGEDGPVFMNLTVKNCSVTGSTITGKGSVGGIIGHGSGNGWTNVVIEETTVKDNTITSTGSSNVKAGAVMGTIGAAGQPTTANGVTKTGGASVSATVAGNTVTSNGTAITTIYGRQGTATGQLYVAGGSYEYYPIEQGVAYAAPIEGYEIVQNTDGTYGIQKIPAYVAKIGEQGYETLAAALAAAQDDDVVTLLADVETADGIVITDKNLVIDLNGKTYTTTEGASTNNRNFKIEGTSVVTIKNGTMVAAGDYSSGAYGTVRTEGSANVTLEGLKLYNYRGNGLNIKACGSSVVTINDTEIYSNYGGGIESAGGTIEIANVKVEQKGMYTAPYNSMAISVNGGGKVTVNSGTFSTECITAEEANNQGTSHGPWVAGVLNSGGTLIINGGTFSNDNFGENSLATYARGAILADTKAKVEINGGKFNVLKNVIDIQNNLGDANNNPSVVLAGGTYNADPRISASYSSNLITLADGYVALPDLNGNYVVGVKPTATVNNLGMTTVAAGDYMVYGNGDNTADMPLSFVMQFLADQDAEDMTKSPFAEWYGDFVITFTGLENGSFTADGCYLAGHYGSFGWVKVPVDGMTIEEGARYPVMLGVGMGQKYDYICSSVQDFKCALYLTPEILEANPNIQVKLELAVVDNSKGSDDAASALINNENVYSVTEYTYDAEDFVVKEYVAKIGETAYATLAEAVAAAEADETITLIADVELTETLNIPAGKTIALDLNGKTISQTKEQTAAYQMILNDGNLTINDSSEAKTGKISYTDSGNGGEYISDVIYNRSVLVINGGTIENLSSATVASNGYPHAVDTYSGIRDTYVEINGGTIYCAEYSAIRMFCVSATNKADLVINGGTIKGAIDMQNGTKNLALGTLTINDGTFETTKNANNIRFANWNGGATEYGISAEIKGGSFNGGITTAYVPAAANWDKGVITGGTFAKDMTEYCAEGFVCEANGDGTYGIVADLNYIAEFTIDDAARVDYVNDTDKTVGTLTYKRTLAEGAWNPLYLPFQVDVAQLADNYDIAYYNQMLSSDSNNDGAFDSYIMEVAYITSGTLKANYPYFIRPKTSDDCYLEYVANDVTLCAAKETVIVTSSVANTFKLHGTHKTVSAADLAGCYTIKASGWVQTTIDLRPHRLYLEILENDNSPFVPAAAKSIRIVVRGEDGYTGVEEITGENCEDMIFDLQGRRVLEPEKGGMYIINGKKVIY